MEKVPEEIMSKYRDGGRTARLSMPDGTKEILKVLKAYFVEDHNRQREYWKGFEVVEWSDGVKELRVCYWTRQRGTKNWVWGQFSTIIDLDRLKSLLKMIEKDPY